MNRFDMAQTQYNKILDKNYRNAIAHISAGNAYYKQNNIEKALVSYRDAIKMSPENDEYKLVYLQVLDEYIDTREN